MIRKKHELKVEGDSKGKDQNGKGSRHMTMVGLVRVTKSSRLTRELFEKSSSRLSRKIMLNCMMLGGYGKVRGPIVSRLATLDFEPAL